MYANITEEVLDYRLKDLDEDGRTLRDSIDYYGEDVEYAEYELGDYDDSLAQINLLTFTAWTEDSILFLNLDVFGDEYVGRLPRNPPKY